MTELLSSVAGRLCLSLCKRKRIKVRDYSLWQEDLIEPSDSIFRLLTFFLVRHAQATRLMRLAPRANAALAGNQHSTTSDNRREGSSRGGRSLRSGAR